MNRLYCYYRDIFSKKIEISENNLLHNPPKFYEIKENFGLLIKYEEMITKYKEEKKSILISKSRMFFTDEKMKNVQKINIIGKNNSYLEFDNKTLEENKINFTPPKNEKLHVKKLFSNTSAIKKKNDNILKNIQETKRKNNEKIKEEIYFIETKLKPFEEEYKFNTYVKSIKSSYDSKSFIYKTVNSIICLLILILLILNIYFSVQKIRNYFREDRFESPIEFIVSEESERERIIFS